MQATADFYQLSEMVKDYVGLVGAVKDVFQVTLSQLSLFPGTVLNVEVMRS